MIYIPKPDFFRLVLVSLFEIVALHYLLDRIIKVSLRNITGEKPFWTNILFARMLPWVKDSGTIISWASFWRRYLRSHLQAVSASSNLSASKCFYLLSFYFLRMFAQTPAEKSACTPILLNICCIRFHLTGP